MKESGKKDVPHVFAGMCMLTPGLFYCTDPLINNIELIVEAAHS
jgi:hypothetical protein